jgi:hypothetical protein
MADEPEFRNVNPKDLRPGPIRHESLTDEQTETLRQIYEILSPYLNTPFEQFELNFLRDVHPEREILIWTLIANALQRFRTEYPSANEEETKAAFKGLLLISMGICRPAEIPQVAWDKLQDIHANR